MGLEVVRLLGEQAGVVAQLLDEVEQPGKLDGGHRHGLGGGGKREEIPVAVAATAGLALHPARLHTAGACGVGGTRPASGRVVMSATLVVVVLANVGHLAASS